MYDPEKVILQAAALDSDAQAVETMLLNALTLGHAGESLHIGSPEPAFGWTFYPVSIKYAAIRQLASLPGTDILKVRGDSMEQKFVNWLNQQAKKKGMAERVHFTLISDLRSSRYGLF
jgi:hypothetical protein